MKLRLTCIVLVALISLGTMAQSSEDLEAQRLRHVILATRHLGAHGLGYNDESLAALSKKITQDDIPALIDLAPDTEVRVGVQFALGSQCENAIYPVREAAVGQKITFLGAEDTMLLIQEFDGCSTDARQRATGMRSELQTLSEIESRKLNEQANLRHAQESAETDRLNRNGLKLLDPEKGKRLTREEREELFHRSVKAMGLKEDGPMTPSQKDLVDRMYRTMVLGENGNRPPN